MPAAHAELQRQRRLTLEPWRARAFPLIKDLVVDRTAFDRIIQAGGFTSINVGGAPDANAILISKNTVEQAMDSAACIGCGACVAACKNASAALFTSAKVSHLGLLPQGQVERYSVSRRWSTATMPRASAAAPTKVNARRSARRRSPRQHRAHEPGLLPRDVDFTGVTLASAGPPRRRHSMPPSGRRHINRQRPSCVALSAAKAGRFFQEAAAATTHSNTRSRGQHPGRPGRQSPRGGELQRVNETFALAVEPPGPTAVTVAR